MENTPLPPSRRDLILMTGLATAGAVVATRGATPADRPTAAQPSVMVDVRALGARGDGATDDSPAVEAALREAASRGTSATLYFPKGDYKIRAGALRVPEGHPMTIRGDGPHATKISFFKSETDPRPLVSLDATFSAVENLQLDGGGARNDAELLVMNRGYNRVSNCNLSRAPGTGLAIGKEQRSIVHFVENIIVRDSRGYGIRVHGASEEGGSGSTDGLWSNVDVGRSGLSGVFLESSSQNMSNVHVWHSGMRAGDTDDQHGFRVTTRNHIFAGCQSEKNLGDGFRFEAGGGEGCVVNGCRVWENGGSGLMGERTNHLTITGSTFMRNGRSNVGDAASATATGAAAIRNEGGDGWTVTGCIAWDDREPLDALWVPEDSTTPEVPRREATMSQTFAYVETGDKGSSAITGGVFRAEKHLSGRSIRCSSPFLRVSGADLGGDDVPSVASAESIDLPAWGEVVKVTGSTRVSRIGPGRPGRVVTLVFLSPGAAGIGGSGASVRLNGSFAPDSGGTITLAYVEDRWREQGRTV